MAKPTTKEIILKVTDTRTKNNLLWMSLLALAVTAKPKKARKIIRAITKNDKAISEWISQL
jgi:hypothetical protein